MRAARIRSFLWIRPRLEQRCGYATRRGRALNCGERKKDALKRARVKFRADFPCYTSVKPFLQHSRCLERRKRSFPSPPRPPQSFHHPHSAAQRFSPSLSGSADCSTSEPRSAAPRCAHTPPAHEVPHCAQCASANGATGAWPKGT